MTAPAGVSTDGRKIYDISPHCHKLSANYLALACLIIAGQMKQLHRSSTHALINLVPSAACLAQISRSIAFIPTMQPLWRHTAKLCLKAAMPLFLEELHLSFLQPLGHHGRRWHSHVYLMMNSK